MGNLKTIAHGMFYPWFRGDTPILFVVFPRIVFFLFLGVTFLFERSELLKSLLS